MFIEKLLKYVLFLFAAALPTYAFWWTPPSATTTTESPMTFKQIPLTYFRTYTYQPISGNPFAAFPFYHHAASAAMPSPLLTGTARYEHATYMPAGAYPMSLALHPQLQQPQLYQLPQQPVLHAKPLTSPITSIISTTTTTKPPTTTSTTTTTTTTTTPPPTTTTTTASSTTRATTSAPVLPLASDVHSLPTYGNDVPNSHPHSYPYPYPTYNRRAYMGYNSHYYRAAYPYPDYTVYKSSPVTRFNSQGGPIKFVPCMCPMSVGNSGAGGESNAALLVQGRTADGEDDGVTVLERTADMNVSDDHKVVDEKEGEQKRDNAVEGKPAVESKVDGQVEAENVLNPNLVQKTVATGTAQLSTNKIEEEVVRAKSVPEGRDRNKGLVVA
ncbi:PREDICTED: mucin-5AC [Rhagoletis zephyria]|uniref:mucin-5AC n=1 Tax=Rhagoletis zephyria TaxID=28612 RepID=UPI0008114FC7|nr:PREDICTED: mucin-5AC [Rhagoletis zephyria]